ncbi:8153_t:CDS:2 [Dentiscutata erythropus]|uniref:8153_t:CDS:1 n=1 Tax=Dentiscutata erythropus TaxID=1348616 RepID=A0A9N9F005_9GLOM|nr:8153_t:CDS:2 [Dentiscutata erythropus]
MLYYIDIFVKISQVHLFNKEELKLTIAQTTGVYPIESEDCELEIVLFVSIYNEERDPNTQSIFEKDEYYSIGRKVVPEYSDSNLELKINYLKNILRDLGSNQCPLKTSLTGIAQNIMKEIDEDRFKHLKSFIQPNESVLFIVGQIKVIENNLYANAVDDYHLSKCAKVEDKMNNYVEHVELTDNDQDFVDSYCDKDNHAKKVKDVRENVKFEDKES